MQTGAVFTANIHVSAAGCITSWLTRSFHCQRTRVSGWLYHELAYAQFSLPTYTCQRLAVSRVGLRAVFTANVHVSAAGCITCLLRRNVNGEIILHCFFLLHRHSSSLLIPYFGFFLSFRLFCMF